MFPDVTAGCGVQRGQTVGRRTDNLLPKQHTVSRGHFQAPAEWRIYCAASELPKCLSFDFLEAFLQRCLRCDDQIGCVPSDTLKKCASRFTALAFRMTKLVLASDARRGFKP